MSASDPLVEQIADELDRALVGPVRSLLGMDLADQVTQRIGERAESIAAQLTSHDPDVAAEVAIDLAQIVNETEAGWWTTPLGVAMLRTHDLTETVSQAEAARMLGVTRQRVAVLIERGKLTTTPLGVTVGSILERMVDLRA